MSRRCDLCGKGPVFGRTYARKGKPKKEGGVGRHVARKNPRRFMPNLQSARALVDERLGTNRARRNPVRSVDPLASAA